MKQLVYVLLLATPILLCGCPDNKAGHNSITFLNKSGKRIGYQISFDRISAIYQDTIFYCNKTSDSFLDNDSSFVLKTPNRIDNWEEDLGASYYIQFLILDGELFKKYFSAPCDTIRKYVPVLHVYRLTQSDLERMNWTVVYPPRGATQAVEQSVHNKKEKK